MTDLRFDELNKLFQSISKKEIATEYNKLSIDGKRAGIMVKRIENNCDGRKMIKCCFNYRFIDDEKRT